MRLPTLRVYRVFRELDGVPDAECRRFVRRVIANRSSFEALVPHMAAASAAIAWAVGWPAAVEWFGATRFVPMPEGWEGRLILLLTTTVLVAALTGLLSRDIMLFLGLRRELSRANCRKCGFSLRGVPISTIGADPDPARTFVRCPECGRKYCLLDIGLAARDLLPFATSEDIARAGQRRG